MLKMRDGMSDSKQVSAFFEIVFLVQTEHRSREKSDKRNTHVSVDVAIQQVYFMRDSQTLSRLSLIYKSHEYVTNGHSQTIMNGVW